MNTVIASSTLLNALIYLDRAYIADLYEVSTGESPATLVTKNQMKKAGAAIPVFSAEVSAQETRSFSVSTFAMLAHVLPILEKEAALNPDVLAAEMPSVYGWVNGNLSVFKGSATVLENKTGEHKVLATDSFFHMRATGCTTDLALITTPEYFSSGLSSFLRLQDTVLKTMSLPVRAFVRVLTATTYLGQWIAVPFVVIERR